MKYDNQFELAITKLSDIVVTITPGVVVGDVVDTQGMDAVAFLFIPDTLGALDAISFGAQDSPDNSAFTAVDRIKILPTRDQETGNLLQIMPGVYEQVFGVVSGERYVKPTLTTTVAVAATVTCSVFAVMRPLNAPFQGNTLTPAPSDLLP